MKIKTNGTKSLENLEICLTDKRNCNIRDLESQMIFSIFSNF